MLLKKNLIYSAIEFLVIALSQFAILRLVAVNLGVAEIGVWSILVSSVQMSKLVEPGAVSGSLRYVALAAGRGEKRAVEGYVSASLFMILAVYIPVLLLLYFFLGDLILSAFDDDRLEASLYLIPYICISFFMQNVSLCFVGCINNMGFGFCKSFANVLGMVLQLVLSLCLVEKYGLLGLTISQLANYIFVVFLALIIMAVYLRLNVFRFFVFRFKLIKKILKIGVFVQGTSICWTIFEFSLRMLMARFGGMDMSGYYEVAYRFAAQVRILASYLVAPITPVFAKKYQDEKVDFKGYYSQIYSNLALFGLAASTGVVILSPLLSVIMFGEADVTFLLFVFACVLGALFHVLAMVSEQCAVSIGSPKYNLVGVLVILVAVYIFGGGFGVLFGATGVAWGALCAISIGAVTTILLNSKKLLYVDCLPRLCTAMIQLFNALKVEKNESTDVSR